MNKLHGFPIRYGSQAIWQRFCKTTAIPLGNSLARESTISRTDAQKKQLNCSSEFFPLDSLTEKELQELMTDGVELVKEVNRILDEARAKKT